MHSIWKGSISFGLVNIPVHMFSGSKERELKFVLLHKKDNSQIRYARICKLEDKEIPWNEIVKGYEYEKDKFVIMEDKDFEKANLKKTQTIEIVSFVDQDEINSVYYVKPYFLKPDKGATKAYEILLAALKKSKKVGIARYVIKNHEHLAVIKPFENGLVLNELRYSDELMKIKEMDLPSAAKIPAKETDMAVKLIDQLTTHFKPEKYEDLYTEEIKQIIKKKAKGRLVKPKEVKSKAKPSKVHDIMELLQASLEKNHHHHRKTA